MEKNVLFYDQQCPLCVRFKQSVERLSIKSLLFEDINDPKLLERYPDLNLDMASQELTLRDEEGG